LDRLDRRRFDHLYEELSVALDRLAPRYALWLHMGEIGLDPESLSRSQAVDFCEVHLTAFLHDHGLALAPGPRRRFEREVRRFDPSRLTPYEHMERLGSPRPPGP
jgi:hypothetical protein